MDKTLEKPDKNGSPDFWNVGANTMTNNSHSLIPEKQVFLSDSHQKTGRTCISIGWNFVLILTTLMVLSACITTPVLAGTKYMSGSPDLSVSIDGNNEFTPGTSVPLTVMVQNSGLNQMKFVQSGIVETDDNPSTAKMVTVTLHPGDCPILVKSDSQMIGDVDSSESVPATFEIRIPDEARAGTYNVPIVLDYTYLGNSEQVGTDSIVYRYINKKDEKILPFVVKSAINLDIVDIQSDSISAGSSGYITLTLKNTGTDAGKKAVAKLVRDENSPIIPVDSNVFLGEFNPDDTMQAKFKVSVSEDAEPQQYPLSLLVTYENADGETVDTPVQKFGIPVGSKVTFTITNPPAEIRPGQKVILEVAYRNDGSVPVFGAEARLSAVDPFTSDDDLAYIGDLKPGETGIAHFKVSVGSDATVKSYGLDSEVKYRDALDDSQISDTIKIPVTIVEKEGIGALLGNPIVIAVLLMIILGAGYYVYTNRKAMPTK